MGQLSLATYQTALIKYLKLFRKNCYRVKISFILIPKEFSFDYGYRNKVKNGLTRVHYLLSLVSIDTKLYNLGHKIYCNEIVRIAFSYP